MAFQIYDKPQQPGLGEIIGAGLGQGAGSVLTALAEQKLQQMAQQQESERLAPLAKTLGVPGYEVLGQKGLLQALSKKQPQSISLGGSHDQRVRFWQDQGMAKDQAEAWADLDPRLTAPAVRRSLESSFVPTEQPSQLPSTPNISEEKPETPNASSATPAQPSDFAKKVTAPTRKEVTAQRRLDIQQQKNDLAKTKFENQEAKETSQPFIKEMNSNLIQIPEMDEKLDRLEQLNEADKFEGTYIREFVKKYAGVDIAALQSASAQEAEKIATDFTRNVKDTFGARVAVQEMQTFLRTVPSLMQTKEGRRRVINQMRALNRSREAYYRAGNQILKDNDYKAPMHLASRAFTMAEPEMNRYWKMGVQGEKIPSRFGEPLKPLAEIAKKAPAGATKGRRNTITGRVEYLINGQWKEA